MFAVVLVAICVGVIMPHADATGDGGLTPMLFMDLQDVAPSPPTWGK